MSVTTDKRKVNYFIACGYCLVVVIILFNYLRTPHNSKGSYRDGTRAAHPNQAAVDMANKELEDQLNEQKRMNKEMREMILDIQNNTTSNVDANNGNTSINTGKTIDSKANKKPSAPKELQVVDLPILNSNISDKFKKDKEFPFDSEKNIFAHPEVYSETDEHIDESLNFPGQTVICNPVLPYIISSSNSEFSLISNY